MKRWYYITAIQLGASSGQTVRIVESCRALAERRPTLLVAPLPPPQPIPGVESTIVRVPARPPRELVFQARLVRTLRRLAVEQRPAVLYTVAAANNLGAILMARRLGIPCVLELNGLPALEYRLERRGRSAAARALVYGLLARLEARLASGFVTVTPQLADQLRRWGARHVHVATNGVNPAAFQLQDRQAARQQHGLPAEAELVGFVGNFAVWQGLETLVRGAALLRQSRPNLGLLLIGDGVERQRMERLAAELGLPAHFTGALPHAVVPGLLSACDVLAAPFAPIPRNLRMGLSALKVAEYLALGRPVLAPALPGMEFIGQQQLGATFAAGDPQALAASLGELLALAPVERAAVGARARAAAEGPYSWGQIIQEVIDFAEALPSAA